MIFVLPIRDPNVELRVPCFHPKLTGSIARSNGHKDQIKAPKNIS